MNRTVNEARNENLLLNIARAEHNHPLTFLAITSVGGSHATSSSIGLPDITIGPAQTVAQGHYTFRNNSIAGNAQASLSVAPLESKEFYTGLLEPINLNAIQFFVGQGYPRQLIFFLVVESIRLKGPRGEVILWNDPTDENFKHFVEYVHRWIDLGVSIEHYGARGKKDKSVRLCFDRGRARLPLNGLGPICGSNNPGVAGLTGLRDDAIGPVSVTLQPRSTYGVFRYLGRLLDPEIGERVQLRGDRIGGISLGNDKRLFPVQINAPLGSECLSRVNYHARDVCVPATGAEQGPMVMQLLTQLIALNTSVKDLPLVPTVRVTN